MSHDEKFLHKIVHGGIYRTIARFFGWADIGKGRSHAFADSGVGHGDIGHRVDLASVDILTYLKKVLELARCGDKYYSMPAYEIFVQCNDCGGEHAILMKIHLDDGPERKQSIAELFKDRPIPPQVAAIRGRKALCLKTGRQFRLENDAQVFLVPPTSFRRDAF